EEDGIRAKLVTGVQTCALPIFVGSVPRMVQRSGTSGPEGTSMATATISPTAYETVADLLHQLGDIPPERLRLVPPPGLATEEDEIGRASCRDRAMNMFGRCQEI